MAVRNVACLAGIDIGTTSTKAGLYRPDGSPICTASVATRLRRDGAGAVEQDPLELLSSACAAIAECVARAGLAPEAVGAIAITGQMAGVMGIDDAGAAVTPYDSWLDARCAGQLDRLAADHGDLVMRVTGCPPLVAHAPKMQWWRQERPADYARIRAFVMPAVYVAMQLAGLEGDRAFVDPSYLHFSGVADGRSASWSPDLLAALEVDAGRMPTIVDSASIVGELTADAAARCGLAAGTPLAAGLGDTAAGVLGAGIVRPGQMLDTAGTAAVLVGSVGAFAADPDHGLIVMRGMVADQFLALNFVAGGGLCLPWLREIATGRELTTLLGEAGAVAPGADGLVFVPHVEGRTAPHDPAMRGGWLGLSLAHSRGHLVRSVLEAIAYEYATYLRAMRRLHPGVAFTEGRVVGGGARSELWNQIKADVLGVRLERLVVDETATRGAALAAGAAVALIDDVAAVAADVSTAAAIEPDPQRHARYAPLVDRYADVVDLVAEHRSLLDPELERHLVA